MISGGEHSGVYLSVQLPDQREGGRQGSQHWGRDHGTQVLFAGDVVQVILEYFEMVAID